MADRDNSMRYRGPGDADGSADADTASTLSLRPDRPGSTPLAKVANRIGGTALQRDITAADAGKRIAMPVAHRHGRKLNILDHNAGITRDKRFANTDADRWGSVLGVSLLDPLRIKDVLLDATRSGGLAERGRIVAISSTSGIGGNRGQANYAASKAGVIATVQAETIALLGQSARAGLPGQLVRVCGQSLIGA